MPCALLNEIYPPISTMYSISKAWYFWSAALTLVQKHISIINLGNEVTAYSWYLFVLIFPSPNGLVPNFAILLSLLQVALNLLKQILSILLMLFASHSFWACLALVSLYFVASLQHHLVSDLLLVCSVKGIISNSIK